MAKLYKTRCSPSCPYDWCVILTDIPPIGMEQESMFGQGEENGDNQSDTSSSSSNSSSNSTSNDQDSNNSDSQDSRNGDSRSDSESNSGNDSDASSGSGGSQQDEGDSNQSTGGSTDKNSGEESEAKGNEGNDGKPQGKPHVAPQSKSDGDSGGEKSDQKDQDGNGDNRDKKSQENQRSKRPEKLEPKYKPVFDIGKPLPDGVTFGGHKGGREGSKIEDLGKHLERQEVLTDRVFQARLRNVMKDNAYDRKVRGRKRGRLDMKSLHKVPAKVENIFTLKEARKNKHYNVILIVDQSGSMFSASNDTYQKLHGQLKIGKISPEQMQRQLRENRLIDIAADCATFLAKSLDKVQVNYSVIGYDTKHRTYKTFDKRSTEDVVKKMSYDLRHTGGGGTAVMPPLKEAYRVLRKTPEYQNIVIGVSDGQPNEQPQVIRRFIQGNNHVADYIDIGIGYKPIMNNGIQIKNIEDLKPMILSELKARIKRG